MPKLVHFDLDLDLGLTSKKKFVPAIFPILTAPSHTKLDIWIHILMVVCCIPKLVHRDLDLSLVLASKKIYVLVHN